MSSDIYTYICVSFSLSHLSLYMTLITFNIFIPDKNDWYIRDFTVPKKGETE